MFFFTQFFSTFSIMEALILFLPLFYFPFQIRSTPAMNDVFDAFNLFSLIEETEEGGESFNFFSDSFFEKNFFFDSYYTREFFETDILNAFDFETHKIGFVTEFFVVDTIETFEIFEDYFYYLIGLIFYFLYIELSDANDEVDGTSNFLQIIFSILCSVSDLFMIFLGFEILTIIIVVGVSLRNERDATTQAMLNYYILSIVASIVLFCIMFYIILITTGNNFFHFFVLGDFFLDFYTFSQNSFNEVIYADFYLPLLKLFFVCVLVLMMLKFSLGPAALWTIYIYPTFSLIFVAYQMVFFKYSLYFFFLEIFDYLFLFDVEFQQFVFNAFTVLLVTTMFLGIFAYKANDLKYIFSVTTLSQIGYLAVGFLTPSFTVLIYSFNYFLLYLYSTLALFFLFAYINIFYNIRETHYLYLVKYLDPTLSLSAVCLIFSMSGLPPFLGFFTKYFLLYKILIQPNLFFIGLVLLVTSFLTTYVYLSLMYSFIKYRQPGFAVQMQTLRASSDRFVIPGSELIYEEILHFFFLILNAGFVLFLASPVLIFFMSEFDEFEELLEELFFYNFSVIVDFYLDLDEDN